MCQVIKDFKISLIEDGKSPKTIESYVGDIKAFIEFLASKGVEFNGTLQRFYVVSYKNFLVLDLILQVYSLGQENLKLQVTLIKLKK